MDSPWSTTGDIPAPTAGEPRRVLPPPKRHTTDETASAAHETPIPDHDSRSEDPLKVKPIGEVSRSTDVLVAFGLMSEWLSSRRPFVSIPERPGISEHASDSFLQDAEPLIASVDDARTLYQDTVYDEITSRPDKVSVYDIPAAALSDFRSKAERGDIDGLPRLTNRDHVLLGKRSGRDVAKVLFHGSSERADEAFEFLDGQLEGAATNAVHMLRYFSYLEAPNNER